MNGWIKLPRDILESVISSRLDLLGLYAYIRCKVNFEPNEVYIHGRNKKVSLEAGQGIFSLLGLSAQFGVGEKKMRNMIEILEREGKVRTERTPKFTIITVIGRGDGLAEEEQKQNKGRTKEEQKQTIKKDKKNKKEKNDKKINNKSANADGNEIVSESTKSSEAGESENLQIQNPPPTPSLSGGFGNPDIDAILSVILKYNDGVIDGSNVQNRRHAKTLMTKIQKFSSVQEGKTSVTQFLETLCSIVSQDKYFAHYLSSPYSIYTNLATLTQRAKSMYHEGVEKSKKQQAQTVDFGSI